MRYALMYPEDVDQLVLVDPIGLEDWKAQGRALAKRRCVVRSRSCTPPPTSIRNYERATYYAGTWKPDTNAGCRCWPDCIAVPGRDIVAWNSALLDDMIYTQPVFYEFGKLTMPVLLMIGDKDTTAFGKYLAPPAIRATFGNYPVLAKTAAARFPRAHLVEFPDLGHAPQIQAPDVFHKALLNGMRSPASGGAAHPEAPAAR